MHSVTIIDMLVLSFFSWWYGRGWKNVLESFGPRISNLLSTFSVSQLIKTWFAPWKRITTDTGSSLAEKFRAWGDNSFSRIIGFFVRTGVLIAALLAIIFTTLLTTIELIAWPLLPIAVPVFLIMGLIG